MQPRRKILILGASAVGKSVCIREMKDRWWTVDMDRMINTTVSHTPEQLLTILERLKNHPSEIVSVSVVRPFLRLLAQERNKPGWKENFSCAILLRLSDRSIHESRLRQKTAEGNMRADGHIHSALSAAEDVDRICSAIADVTFDVDGMSEAEVAATVAEHCQRVFDDEARRDERARRYSRLRSAVQSSFSNLIRPFIHSSQNSNEKARSSMITYLSRAEYDEKTKAIGGKHWASAGSRWAYHNLAVSWAKELNLSSPDAVLEQGPMGVTIVGASKTMDYDAASNNVDWLIPGYQPTYIYDARKLPWPFKDKEFELLVSLRVLQHLVPKQRECFLEAKRVSRAMILVIPTKSVHPRGIDREQLVEWNGGVEPTKEHHYPGQLGSAYLFKW